MIHKTIIEMLPENVKVVLDTRGEPFKYALEKGVFLTKPNNVELGEFFNEKYETMEEIINAGEKLRKMGSENVLISLGKNGSVLITEKGVWIGNVPKGVLISLGKNGSVLITEKGVWIGNVPKGTLVSSVGAGDSMVAGTLYGIVKGREISEAYKYGIASGSATAFTEGLTTLENMENLLNDINIKMGGNSNVK